jgi:hypothetical protein
LGSTAEDKPVFKEHVETVTLKTFVKDKGTCKALKGPLSK